MALMLKNYGFRVIDLGKDVPKEVIIETAKKEHADIIALSALMTTTMQQMKHVIEYAKEQGVTAKVLIGGCSHYAGIMRMRSAQTVIPRTQRRQSKLQSRCLDCVIKKMAYCEMHI